MARIQEVPVQPASPRQTRRATSTPASVYDRVGSAVAKEVALRRKKRNEQLRELSKRRRSSRKVNATAEVVTEEQLELEVSAAMAEILEKSLDALSVEDRMALIARLSGDARPPVSRPAATRASSASPMLTTADVATLLEVSRPYVSMLCDAGKLGSVVKTEGGHRRVAKSAVDAYLAERTAAYADAPSMREAGIAAGLYEKEDEDYVAEPRTAAATTVTKPRQTAVIAAANAPKRSQAK